MNLGVNVDHVATLRETRKGTYPDPVEATKTCEAAGADSIIVHLREDRRHIKDSDLWKIKQTIKIPLNLEMSIAKEIVDIALEVKPNRITLVPEKRKELTTEGGLNLVKYKKKVSQVIQQMKEKNINTSLFIDPEKEQIDIAKEIGADIIELHTGFYSDAKDPENQKEELSRIKEAASYAKDLGLEVSAGHGLNYENVKQIAQIPEIEELNIGHSIVSRAVFLGLAQAVKEMLSLIG